MYVILIIAFAYFLLHVLFLYGLRKSVSTPYAGAAPKPFVTILVAARNERQNIRACIDSLKSVLYEKELLEIIASDIPDARLACQLHGDATVELKYLGKDF